MTAPVSVQILTPLEQSAARLAGNSSFGDTVTRLTRPVSPRSHAAALLLAAAASTLFAAAAAAQQAPAFTPGNLVVVVEGCGVVGGTCAGTPNGTGDGTLNSSSTGYGDNQAGPLTLFQYTPVNTSSATYAGSFVLPQAASGSNFPVSGEYGSSSEGSIQLSTDGKLLTVMGYGVPAASFNASPATYGASPSNALAQSGSLTGQVYTAVPRVVALVNGCGVVNSSTALYNVFNTNNPRSAATVNGTSAYVSGQGAKDDATSGVFYTAVGAVNNAPTAITGLDATNNTVSQDTRVVQIVNGTLYVSADTKGGSNAARSYIGTLGTAGTLPTTAVGGPVMLTGFGNTGGTGKVTITTGSNGNGNGLNSGVQINVSPSGYFFASPSVLYVADTGNGKQTSATSTIGDGGLQKWINSKTDGSGTWSLAYTLANGLNLVTNPATNSGHTSGTTGLYSLAGNVVGNSVYLYAVNSTIADLDTTYLYGITDNLTYTTASQASTETFTKLATAPADSNFKGVTFAPSTPTPTTPVITWSNPAAISFGSALSSAQLNATTTVPGTFTYSPAAGTVLQAGANQALSVTFTPTDGCDYNSATATVHITVNAATPAALVLTKSLSRASNTVTAQVTLSNTGGTAAQNIVLSSVKIGSLTATPLPQTAASIPAGGSTTFTVTVPGTVGASGAASSFTASGTYSGGSFSTSARITLP